MLRTIQYKVTYFMVILQVYVNISLKLPGTGKILPCDTRTRVLGCGLPNVTVKVW